MISVQIYIQIKEWNTNFTKLGEKRTGYRKDQVTVYMHGAAYHIPQMIEKNDNIKQFSGQGNEKSWNAVFYSNQSLKSLTCNSCDYKLKGHAIILQLLFQALKRMMMQDA